MSIPLRATAAAHEAVQKTLHAGDWAIDATTGNGHDTIFMACLVGAKGKVLAFDIQETAIESARRRVQEQGLSDRVEFFHKSHAYLAEHAERPPAVVMFNLGYLPGGDHNIITRGAETVRALDAAWSVLRPGGLLTIVCYPGHPGGAAECAMVLAWARRQDVAIDPIPDGSRPFLVLARR